MATIGVSAHRNIARDAAPAVEAAVSRVLREIKSVCPTPVMLNGLAEGGDLMCGEQAVRAGIKLFVSLPAAESEYLNDDDFCERSRNKYLELVGGDMIAGKAVAPRKVFTGDHRFDGFYSQTVYVVVCCDVLLALWDGTECANIAAECGTNAAVALAKKCGKPIIAVFAPRQGRTYDTALHAGDVRYIAADGTDKSGIAQLNIRGI